MEKEVSDTEKLIAFLENLAMEATEADGYIEEVIAKLRRLEALEDLQRRRHSY